MPNEQGKFKCQLCNCILSLRAGKQEVVKHANSKKHLAKINARKSTPSVKSMFQESQTATSIKDEIATAEIRISAFFAEHNIAVSVADDLVDLIKVTCNKPDVVKGISLARTKTTEVINNVLCKVETSELISILKVIKFSILVDESTDLSMDKYLCILVRYVCPESGNLMTKLLKMLKLEATDTTAENIYRQFKQFFKACDIPLTNIIGLASDGANVMLGKHNSFMTRLMADTKVLVVLKCICHSAAIIASTACNVLPAAPEDLLRALSSYVSASGKRSAQLAELQEYLNNSKKKILKLSSTRWLCLHQCIERVLEMWSTLQHFFLLASTEDHLKQTKFILDALNCSETKAYLLFLKYVLNFLNSFNALFQAKTVLIHQLGAESRRIYFKFCNNFIKPSEIKIDVNCNLPINFVDIWKVYLGSDCENFILNLEVDVQKKIRLKCLEFYSVCCREMQNRLPMQDIFFNELLFITPKIALSLERPEECQQISAVISKFQAILDKKNEIETEWRNIQFHFSDEEKMELLELPISKFWHRIRETKDFSDKSIFINIATLALLVLSLPHSNAGAERVFSIMNDVKTKKRNRLQENTLNSLCVLRSHFQETGTNAAKMCVNEKHLDLMKSKNLYC